MSDDFVSPGGTHVVIRWLRDLYEDPDNRSVWEAFDQNMRLCQAQSWMCEQGYGNIPHRDVMANALALGEHEHFEEMIADLGTYLWPIYAWLKGEPALLDKSDMVAVDLELVVVTSSSPTGRYEAGEEMFIHSFIMRLVDGAWKIAARARMMPVPGWPPENGAEVATLQ